MPGQLCSTTVFKSVSVVNHIRIWIIVVFWHMHFSFTNITPPRHLKIAAGHVVISVKFQLILLPYWQRNKSEVRLQNWSSYVLLSTLLNAKSQCRSAFMILHAVSSVPHMYLWWFNVKTCAALHVSLLWVRVRHRLCVCVCVFKRVVGNS